MTRLVPWTAMLGVIFLLSGCGSGEEGCKPDCDGKECGPDGCGGTCPPGCSDGLKCYEDEGTCVECTMNRDCEPGYYCELTVHECREETCPPDCDGKECGPDGCGGICPPGCDAGETCNEATGQCEGCTPDCDGKECGPDGCGGTCPPGCGAGETCNETTGQCEGCAPDCGGKECGPDGCGGTCPPGCDAGQTCNETTGQCEGCTPDCSGKECGPDGCGGTCPPGCDAGESCNQTTGQCECVPACSGKECGPDGCGGTCPPGCDAGEACNETTGQCECVPACSGKECGPDGCGGSCPPGCDVGETCNEDTGQCACVPECSGKECGPDGCGGNCPPGCEAGEFCNNGACEPVTAELAWVQIEGGTYMMGSDTGDDDEQPVHQVTVPDFEMTVSEVTVMQYAACVDEGACTAPHTGGSCNWEVAGRENHPVNCPTWYQAVDFCEWAGGRLPSEAEWEYAARSEGQDIEYPWGNETATCDYAVMDDFGVGDGCGHDSTLPVCSKPAGNTDQGLCDMAGNVYDWVQDCYHDSYEGAPSDGSAWEDPTNYYRVLRGGSWVDWNDYLRVTYRIRYMTSEGYTFMGFRCAR